MTRRAGVLILAVGLSLWAGPAAAHKMKLFATLEGRTVAGYAYFTGGTRAQEAQLIARASDGTELFRGGVDAAGAFQFTLARDGAVFLTAEGGDGHRATFTLAAEDAAVASPPSAPEGDLAALIDRSVARQIRPLREQIDALQDQTRLSDLLGGLGVIFGLGGVAYGMALRARLRRGPL